VRALEVEGIMISLTSDKGKLVPHLAFRRLVLRDNAAFMLDIFEVGSMVAVYQQWGITILTQDWKRIYVGVSLAVGSMSTLDQSSISLTP
jgi:hypothetical protein